MKKKGSFLYYLTAGWALLIVAIGFHFLFSSMEPTADVKSGYQSRLHNVPIESWEPGDFKTLTILGKPVVIWRRSPAEMATAMSQADPNIALEDWAEALNNGSLARALDPEDFARVEWFIGSPISPASFGCIVLTQAGNYDGFFDPCQGAHFDLWGRVRQGPTPENLTVHPIDFTGDRQSLVIDISRLPSLR